MVSAAMKLKDACSLEESYDRPKEYVKKQRQTFSSWDSKSLQMMTAAMKLKDAYSLEEKL